MPTGLMTGGHAGLGLKGARTLAKRFGRNLILSGRNPERVEEAARQLRKETGVRLEVLMMDLNSLASVRAGLWSDSEALVHLAASERPQSLTSAHTP